MATSWPVVFDRLTSLTVARGFALAKEPFSFDLQPDGRLDAVCRLEGALDGVSGYLGGDQEEAWVASIWLAEKRQRDAHAAYRGLQTSVDSLTAAIAADETAGDYCVGEDWRVELQQPAEDAGYLVGMVTLPITIERVMS